MSPARGVFLALAFLALALKVLIPAGFMAAAPTNDLPFAIVLCTGQGPVALAPGQGLGNHEDQLPGPADGAHDSPCAFAGHGAAAPAPSALGATTVEFVAYRAAPVVVATYLSPGRGLAAPPLPARGPPSLSI